MKRAEAPLEVSVITPDQTLYQGKAHSVIMPGYMGVFEVLPHHKNLLSLLGMGDFIVDGNVIPIWRGIVKINLNNITAIVEMATP